MEEARRTTDPGRRAALYRELQRVLAQDLPALPLYYPVYTYAIDSAVQDVQIGPMWDTPDRFRTITQWYAATRRVMVSEAPFLQLGDQQH
jgi:peptide/nickel transport system substrate-binding protein